jgi:serpin B
MDDEGADARQEHAVDALSQLGADQSGRSWPVGATLRHRAERRRRRRRGAGLAGVVAVVLVVTVAAVGVANRSPSTRSAAPPSPTAPSEFVRTTIGSAVEVASMAPPATPPATGTATTAAAGAEQSFSLSLLGRLIATTPSTNQVASPYSLAEALLMLELGAKGATAIQIGQALGMEAMSPAEQAGAWASLAADLEQGATADKVALQDADSVWVQPGFTVQPQYLASLRQTFDAGVWKADFAHQPAAAVAAVNEWVSRQTHGKITQLLSAGEVDDQTVLALLNAVYFKAPWRTPLSEEPPATFHAPGGDVNVPYLSNAGSMGGLLKTYVGDGVEEVELPYWNGVPATDQSLNAGGAGRYAADIIMPTAQGLPQWVEGLTSSSWQHLMGQLTRQSVALRFPKFSLHGNQELNQILQTLGMTDAFSSQRADLSGISPEATYVKFVRQAATLDVTKWGTVATAATAVGVEATSVRAQTLAVTIDRPFLFVIRDTATGAILFTAAVDNPAASG